MIRMFSDLNAFQHDPLGFLQERAAQSEGPFAKLNLGPIPIYQVTEPEFIKPIMKASEREIDKGRLIHKLRKIVGKSSLTISGDEHKRRRQAIHANLGRGISGQYVSEMSAIARGFIFEAVRDGEFDAHTLSARFALKTIATVLFGDGVLSSADEALLIHAVKLVEDDLAADMFRIAPPLPHIWWKQRKNLREAKSIMRFIVEKTIKNASRQSLLRVLIDMELSEEQLHDELLMILLAGHHTTGSAAAWLFYFMARDPDLFAVMADEAHYAFGDDGEIEQSTLKSLPVLNRVIKEVLRLYPSAWWFSREVRKPVTLGDVTFKKGTSFIISPYQMQRDPRFFDNPDEFNLDRDFSSPAYVPFGVGPRACVGMGFALLEMQVLALEFASSCALELASPKVAEAPTASITLVPPKITVRAKIKDRITAAVDAAE
ncbi:MAG: cytochrome P450 [Pseudomonadota bacterium]